jgi:hypothetical protein
VVGIGSVPHSEEEAEGDNGEKAHHFLCSAQAPNSSVR